jgi:hypothetical protein
MEALVAATGVVIAIAGCTFKPDDSPIIDAPADTMGHDAGHDAGSSACTWAFPPSNFDPSDPHLQTALPQLSFANGAWVYDTDTGVLVPPSGSNSTPASAVIDQSGGPSVRVIVVTALDVPQGGGLLVQGSMPLIFAATTIDVVGTINAVAIGTASGPGASTSCSSGSAGSGTGGVNGGGGGGGGGNGSPGAAGATGDSGGGNGGPAGNSTGTASLVPLVGGCPGAVGGDSGSNAGGSGGGGGGALQLSACESISIMSGAVVDVGGGGGATGTFRSGGGGGGAGGSLLVESPTIGVMAGARLCSNGGAGGDGGGQTGPTFAGQDASCSATMGATAEPGGSSEGVGGGGSFGTTAAGQGQPGMGGRGAGGGGGGFGRIHFHGTATVSPTAVVTPANM